jgi:hypothetical protein
MAEQSPVLVPTDPNKCSGRRSDLVAFWKAKGLLSGETDPDCDHWYLGANSPDPYPQIVFDYLHVYDGGHRFVPMEDCMGWDAHCPHCTSSLDETLFELRDDWPDNSEDETTSMQDWTVTCPSCKNPAPLRDLPANAAMTPFFVHLGAGDLGEDRGAEFLADLEAFLGTPFKVLWMSL